MCLRHAEEAALWGNSKTNNGRIKCFLNTTEEGRHETQLNLWHSKNGWWKYVNKY